MFETEIENTLTYLNSPEASESLKQDPYWPKWHSPWWHMLLLHEMGLTNRIPAHIIEEFIASLDRIPLKIFPIHPSEMPADIDPFRGTPCHCQLGNVYQVLAQWGVNVDNRLPWIRPWFLKYQMADGGLNCDNDAYGVKDEVPSSMVGTIAAFEAVLLYTKRPFTKDELQFLDAASKFLIRRKLKEGCSSRHNASERESAKAWPQPCFPRYYFYDTLRGLAALKAWSKITKNPLPEDITQDIAAKFGNEPIRIERRPVENQGTLLRDGAGVWQRRQPATWFPLLDKVSRIGEVSPFLKC